MNFSKLFVFNKLLTDVLNSGSNVLSCKTEDYLVSYLPFGSEGEETALILYENNKRTKTLILSGDHRKQYEKIHNETPNQIMMMKYYFDNRDKHPNGWDEGRLVYP